MSSNEDEYGFGGGEGHRGKKRRVARACDVCRRRKSRCDGSQVDGDKCSTCLDANLDCTYLQAATKRTPARSNYIESLEARLERSETQIKQLRAELAAAHFAKSSSSASALSLGSNGQLTTDKAAASLTVLRSALRSLSVPPPPPAPDDLLHLEIARKLEKLSVNGPPDVRFMGKSSSVSLVKAAIDLKEDVNRGARRRASESVHSRADSSPNGSGFASTLSGSPDDGGEDMDHGHGSEGSDDDGESDEERSASALPWTSRRLQYWTFKPWENTALRTHTYTFPPLPLIHELTVLYFTHVNTYLPLLHRPTFERGISEGLFLTNDGFAGTVLLMCAVAARWAPDPRTGAPANGYAQGQGNGVNGAYEMDNNNANRAPGFGIACGWGWFDQVPLVGNHMFGRATLWDLQYYCLAVQFLEGSSAPQACWTLIGVGLRLAQDIGIHRRIARIEKPSVEREQLKRAFWVLVFLDRIVSSGMGRPCVLQFDDYDIDLPIECDDEYWEHPTHPFQQPPGMPSRVTYFNTMIKLNHILAFSLKILYSLNKVRAVFSITDAWEENVVAELDSALNSWRDKVPEHLRWDPARADPVFFDQSVALQCGYHHLQILIHRPFIPMLRKSAPTALPSLAICTSAARACANVVDVQRQRKGNIPVVCNLNAVFTSAIVLLLNVWSGKRTGLVPDPTREIANVQKCMEVVRVCEDRWQHAGLLWDIMAELASVGQMPLLNGMNGEHHDPAGDASPPRKLNTAPPIKGGARYPACVIAEPSLEDRARILQGSRGLRPTFQRPISDPSWSAPYAPPMPPPGSFAGGVGGANGTFGPAPMEPSAFAPSPSEGWDPPADPFASMHNGAAGSGDPTQASAELGDMMNLIDNDTIAMWANAPVGLEVDDWGTYFNNFSELTQGQSQMQGVWGE